MRSNALYTVKIASASAYGILHDCILHYATRIGFLITFYFLSKSQYGISDRQQRHTQHSACNGITLTFQTRDAGHNARVSIVFHIIVDELGTSNSTQHEIELQLGNAPSENTNLRQTLGSYRTDRRWRQQD